ncbi:MAG TPA: hypothetical protein EYH42_04980 [Sulfurovum sp.]|nr:hypothetical protein [Sulfurovum sp.]
MKKTFGMMLLVMGVLTGLYSVEKTIADAIQNTSKKSIIVYTIPGNAEKIYNNMMDEQLKTLGFLSPDPRKNVHKVYQKMYGSTTLDLLSFMTIVDKKSVKPLLNIDPTLAGFNPFNLLMYKHKDKNETIISHLTTEAIFDMLGTGDKEVMDGYRKSMAKLDALIVSNFPHAKVTYETYDTTAEDTMMHFELEFKRPEKLMDFVDEIQEKVEETFEAKGYIMAGFFNFKETFDGSNLLPQMDEFWTFSLCHFKYSYAFFDNAGARPDAAVFAPCTMYMYIQKGTNKLVVGMPRLQNWLSMFDIKDKARIEYNQKLDKEIVEIFKEMGFKEVDSTTYRPIKL